jgi:hypothetical protein
MFANMPVGTPHSFKNVSGKPARMLISLAPAGLEQMFFEFGVPVPQGATTAPPPTKEEIENRWQLRRSTASNSFCQSRNRSCRRRVAATTR